jgi:hypothetical protein
VTLAVTVVCQDGLVVAADSRTTLASDRTLRAAMHDLGKELHEVVPLVEACRYRIPFDSMNLQDGIDFAVLWMLPGMARGLGRVNNGAVGG